MDADDEGVFAALDEPPALPVPTGFPPLLPVIFVFAVLLILAQPFANPLDRTKRNPFR
jgi:hypothetical protein